MRSVTAPVAFLFTMAVVVSCKKDNTSDSGCFPNAATLRQITNAPAKVKKAGEQFYIVEQGTIDTKLNPCTLPQEFQVDNLQVVISGDVKSTLRDGTEPCCTENFVITSIAR